MAKWYLFNGHAHRVVKGSVTLCGIRLPENAEPVNGTNQGNSHTPNTSHVLRAGVAVSLAKAAGAKRIDKVMCESCLLKNLDRWAKCGAGCHNQLETERKEESGQH